MKCIFFKDEKCPYFKSHPESDTYCKTNCEKSERVLTVGINQFNKCIYDENVECIYFPYEPADEDFCAVECDLIDEMIDEEEDMEDPTAFGIG